MSINLKDYVCTVPFEALEIMEHKNFMCCASWLLKELPNNVPLKDLWNSEEAIDIRKSVMDGSYRHCDKTKCPFLSELIALNNISKGPIVHKNNLNDIIKKNYETQDGYLEEGPKIIQLSFDRTCNFKCPSCRVDMIIANSDKIKTINLTIEEIEETYSNSIQIIYCSGTADPFASVTYRNYLRNFNPKKYPNLKSIHLHTNASLWNKEMWDSMPNIHKYVSSCEISIDAGESNTYENITRLGGKWDILIDNLKFISTINSIQSIKCSFVVQQSNYMEMQTFYNLMYSIFGRNVKVFFGRITNWGTYTDGQFKLVDVGDKTHPEHLLFVNEFKKVATNPYVFHNMYDLLDIKKSLI
jgi:hypothetical protein